MRKLIHAVKGWIKGAPEKVGQSAIVYVYGTGKDGDINPSDQINILRRLSSFTDKEQLPVIVIFPGRPSRKIPDGTSQGMVEVRYATDDQMTSVVTKAIAAAKKNHSAVLAVNRPELEKWAKSNRVRHIRATTFEKSLDSICGPLRRDQPQQPQRQPQGQPPRQAHPQRQPQPEAASETSPETEAPAAESHGEHETDSDDESAPMDAPAPAPAPRQEPSRKLHRHDPHAKKEERDQAILDLIDPL